ncbi:MAG: SpaH/EbpB family LPXTG-anchored major pilin [Acutalibacteraceae bacterium]
MKKIKNRIVPFLLAFAILLTMMPIFSFQPAEAKIVDKFKAAYDNATFNVNGNYIHAYLVGTALNSTSYFSGMNTSSTKDLANQVKNISGAKSVTMNRSSYPTNDNICYIVIDEVNYSFIGFLYNGRLRYNSQSNGGCYDCSVSGTDRTFTVGYKCTEEVADAIITKIEVSNITENGYRVTCYFSSMDGITTVKFPTWTQMNGQDAGDIKWHIGEISGDSAYYDVKVSDHNYEFGKYNTHVYAYNSSGGVVCKGEKNDIFVPPVDLGDDFYAYINVIGNEINGPYTVDAAGKTLAVNGDSPFVQPVLQNVKAHTPKYNDMKQIWHFIRRTDNYYFIQNISDGRYLNSDGNNTGAGTPVCAHDPGSDNMTDNFRWGLQVNTTNSIKGVTCYYLKPKTVVKANADTVLNISGDQSGQTNLNTQNEDKNERFYIMKINKVDTKQLTTLQTLYDINTTHHNTRVAADDNGTDVQFRNDAISDPVTLKLRHQLWQFEQVSSGESKPYIYRIKNVQFGKYLQADTSDKDANEVSIAEKDETSDSQKWILIGDSLNNTRLVPLSFTTRDYAYYVNGSSWSNTNTVQGLNATNGYTQDGSYSIKVYADDFTDAMKFKIAYVRDYADNLGDFYTSITSYAQDSSGNSYAISLSRNGNDSNDNPYTLGDAGTVAGVKLRKIADDSAVDQQWYFKYLGDGLYSIQNLANGYYLYREGGTTVRAHEIFKDIDDEKWYVVKEPNGGYSLSPSTNYSYPIDILYATVEDEKGLNLQNKANGTVAQRYKLSVTSKTAPAYGENLGDKFWAYITLNDNPDKILTCGNTYNPVNTNDDKMYVYDTAENEKKQENYWKFERQNDGSYKISSCNVVNNVLDKRNGNPGFNTDQDVSVWESNTGYGQRWFIRKYSDGYRIESKLDGRVLTLQSDNSILVTHPVSDHTNQLFNIVKTDMVADSDMPNVKMHLFNYGRAINSATDKVLPFFNGSRNETKYVDTDGNAHEYEMKDIKPAMKKTLVNGYPYITNTYNSSSNNSNVVSIFGGIREGSLKYLFDENMGGATGFVQGNNNSNGNTVSSYNLPSSDYKTNSNYQSQRFDINNPSSLFKKDETTGLYGYDSLLNAAYFQRDSDTAITGNFKLFDYTMTVHAGEGFEYKAYDNNGNRYSTVTGISEYNGNFYPFNLAHEEGVVDYGTQTGNSRLTIPNSTDYVPVNYTIDSSNPVDCWFGMTLECDFQMTKDGTYNGSPMQFNFKGDDDVWLYIDDVLVLDIGGTHGATEGTIDFSTGRVTDPVYPGGTTLKALYTTAMTELGKSTAEINTMIADNFTGDTFKANTNHTMKFFYMERGGVVSSCKINFNLSKGSPSVTKEVDYSDPDFTDKRDYTFKIDQEVLNKPGEYTSLGSGITYLLEGSDGTSQDKIPLSSNGIFTLKPGQTAHFHDINDGTKFRVTEIYEADSGVESTTAKYTKFNNDDSTVVQVDEMTFNDKNDRVVGPYELETNVEQSIAFTNKLKTKILTIKKDVFANGKTEPLNSVPGAVYNFGLRLFKQNGDETIELGTKKFSIKGEEIANGYEVEVPVGVSYQLWEYEPTDDADTYLAPTFKNNENPTPVSKTFVVKTASESDGIKGEIGDDEDTEEVTVTNTIETTSLKIKKAVFDITNNTTLESVPGAVYKFGVQLYQEKSDGIIEKYGEVREFTIKGQEINEADKEYIIIKDLPPVGISYELWEYYPDDEGHNYLDLTFKDDAQTDSVKSGFVVNTVGENKITGEIKGGNNKVTATNTIKTTKLIIKKEVFALSKDADNNTVTTQQTSVIDAVYKFGLRLFRMDSDGTLHQFDEKILSIRGEEISDADGYIVDNLPVGVSYQLWEYYPNDDAHRYITPSFKDDAQSTAVKKNFADGTIGENDGIKGEIKDDNNKVTVTNMYDVDQTVKFYKTDDKQSVNVGETVNYTITGEIPNTNGYTSYTYKITDTMSSGLTFNADSLNVKIKGTDITLTRNTDYSYSPNNSGFELNIYVKNTNLQEHVKEDMVITYSATVNKNAVAKIENNTAQLEYSKDTSSTTKTAEFKEQVYSSKIVVDKYKAGETSTKLSGAEFYLYKNVNGSKQYYKSDTNGVVSWVDTQNTATKKTTDANGATSFDGIADGTYYLEEVKAPDGYNRLAEDVEVTINGGGENPVVENLTVTKSIENRAGAKLPESGSTGLSMFFVIGGGIILMCSLLLIVFRIRPSRKR